jgi:hypothetical protein
VDDDDEFVRELHQHKHILLVVIFELLLVVIFEILVLDVVERVQHNKHHHHLLDMMDHVGRVQLFGVLSFQLDYSK